MTVEDLENNKNSLMAKITQAAKNNIPIKRYQILSAFTPSTRTKKLQMIYNQRHEQYRNNMTNQKTLIFVKIKAIIYKNYKADNDSYWQNQIKKLEEIKSTDLKRFYKKYTT